MVTISSSNSDRIKSGVEKLKTSYPSATVSGFACDLSKPTVEQDIETLLKQVGTVDHIVYTAGDALASMPVDDITYEAIIKAGQMRFFAPLLVAKVGSKYMTPGPTSSIVLTGGGVAERPIPNWSIVAG